MSLCYTNHKTGDVDHMNAHIKAAKCGVRRVKRPRSKIKHDARNGCLDCRREGEIKGLLRATRFALREASYNLDKTKYAFALTRSRDWWQGAENETRIFVQWCRAEAARLRKRAAEPKP